MQWEADRRFILRWLGRVTLGEAVGVVVKANRPPLAQWLLATGLGATLAWTLGMPLGGIGLDLATPMEWAAACLGALLLLFSIPIAQAVVLRRRRGTLRWLVANAGAWPVARHMLADPLTREGFRDPAERARW